MTFLKKKNKNGAPLSKLAGVARCAWVSKNSPRCVKADLRPLAGNGRARGVPHAHKAIHEYQLITKMHGPPRSPPWWVATPLDPTAAPPQRLQQPRRRDRARRPARQRACASAQRTQRRVGGHAAQDGAVADRAASLPRQNRRCQRGARARAEHCGQGRALSQAIQGDTLQAGCTRQPRCWGWVDAGASGSGARLPGGREGQKGAGHARRR